MKIHQYNEMIAHLTRPRQKYANGGEVIPPKKPYNAETFKEKSDLYLQAILGTEEKDFYKLKLQNEYEKAMKEEVLSSEEAMNWVQERAKLYSTLIDESKRQKRSLGQELGNVGGFSLPSAYGLEDGGRVGLEGGSDIFTLDAHGSKTGAQQIEGAPKGWTSDKEMFDVIAALKIPVSKKIKILADLQYGKYRDQMEYKDQDVYLEDPKSYRDRKLGVSYNEGGEGLSGHAKVNVDTGDPEAYIQFTKKFEDGGRAGFNDGSPRKIYKTITPITEASRTNAANRGVIIPHDAKWKIQLPGSAIRGSDSTTQMVYGKTKKELNTALKDAEKIKYVKPKLPKNDPNHPLYEPFVPKKEKFFVKKETPKRITQNINEVIYEEVLGSKNHPDTYKKTGKVVKKYKPMIGVDKVTIPGEGVDTLAKAQEFVDNYFKKNPKKIIEKDPDAPQKSKDLKKQKIIAAGGEPLWLTGDPDVHKGHGTQVSNPETTIKPSNIFATPEKINIAMAPKDTDTPKNIYTDLDFKIDAEEAKMKNIKESNLPDSEKKIKLQAIDDKLTDYAIASKGYKTVTLSDGSTFNLGTQSTKSYDMMDIFPNMSEQDVKKFTRKYFTDTGKLKSEWTKGNISDVDKENIKKSYVFLENVKNAKANAKKILPNVDKEFKKFGLTLNKDQVNKAKTFLRNAMNKGQDIFKYIPNKVVRKGGGAAVAVLDYALFHHLFGVPGTEAFIGASGWLTKNPQLGKSIVTTAMMAGEAEGTKPPQEEIIDEKTIIKDRPFVWKQGVLESEKPVYGKYADEIKNLKVL